MTLLCRHVPGPGVTRNEGVPGSSAGVGSHAEPAPADPDLADFVAPTGAHRREHLRRALELATLCGAAPLAARAETELRAAGARPRRITLRGVESLTPSERRVAELAAEVPTNGEIAQALFVTPRTVEGHLTSAYRKLEIASRAELAAALSEPSRT